MKRPYIPAGCDQQGRVESGRYVGGLRVVRNDPDEIRAAQREGARMDFQNTSPFFIHDTSPGALSPRIPRVQPSLIALPPIRKPGRIRLALRRAWRWLMAPRCAL